MDLKAVPGADVVHDMLEFPWPFPSGHFDEILLRHVLEHVPHDIGLRPYKDGFLAVLEECHRILKPAGIVQIYTPHPRSENTIIDPTHTRVVHPRNFDYFDPSKRPEALHYSDARFTVGSMRVSQRAPIARRLFPVTPEGEGLTVHLVARIPGLRWLLSWSPDELHTILVKA